MGEWIDRHMDKLAIGSIVGIIALFIWAGIAAERMHRDHREAASAACADARDYADCRIRFYDAHGWETDEARARNQQSVVIYNR